MKRSVKGPTSIGSRCKHAIAFAALAICTIKGVQAQTAAFTADRTAGCFPITVAFTDASTGNINSWSWDFGNGKTSNIQNPQVQYTEAGTYTVTLQVSNGSQSDTEVKTGYIVVHSYPQVDFSFDKTSGCSPLTVHFTNLVSETSGIITSWQWVFGDGGTSNVANPSYTYYQAGSPSVSLKATNVYGCESTNTKVSAIDVFGPDVQFTPSATTLCQVPSLIQFDNQSTGLGVLQHHWNFGDGQTSDEMSPSHSFTEVGVFTVRLTTTDAQGCVSFKEVEIFAGAEGGLDFSPSLLKLCIG
ncbi:MAG TPA: PKD domain-containing protein [Chryseosolibacter sp.]